MVKIELILLFTSICSFTHNCKEVRGERKVQNNKCCTNHATSKDRGHTGPCHGHGDDEDEVGVGGHDGEADRGEENQEEGAKHYLTWRHLKYQIDEDCFRN